MHKLSTTYLWTENVHSKKIFKNKLNRPSENHRLISLKYPPTELKLEDPEIGVICTDITAVMKVSMRYGRYEAEANIFDNRMAMFRTHDHINRPLAQGYRCTRSFIYMNIVKKSPDYWMRIKGCIYEDMNSEEAAKDIAVSPSLRNMFTEEKMHEYIHTFITIPSITREIRKYLPL
jgi:hypothetical protein